MYVSHLSFNNLFRRSKTKKQKIQPHGPTHLEGETIDIHHGVANNMNSRHNIFLTFFVSRKLKIRRKQIRTQSKKKAEHQCLCGMDPSTLLHPSSSQHELAPPGSSYSSATQRIREIKRWVAACTGRGESNYSTRASTGIQRCRNFSPLETKLI